MNGRRTDPNPQISITITCPYCNDGKPRNAETPKTFSHSVASIHEFLDIHFCKCVIVDPKDFIPIETIGMDHLTLRIIYKHSVCGLITHIS